MRLVLLAVVGEGALAGFFSGSGGMADDIAICVPQDAGSAFTSRVAYGSTAIRHAIYLIGIRVVTGILRDVWDCER